MTIRSGEQMLSAPPARQGPASARRGRHWLLSVAMEPFLLDGPRMGGETQCVA